MMIRSSLAPTAVGVARRAAAYWLSPWRHGQSPRRDLRNSAAGIGAMLCTMVLSLPAAAELGGQRYSYSFNDGAGVSGMATHRLYSSRHGAFYPYNGTLVSQFFVQRDYGAGALHYGGLTAEDEHHYYGGLSMGPATLAVFQGEAESFSKAPNALYPDLNQYFFHGGSRADFELQGVAGNVALGSGFHTRFAATNVSASGVQDRNGYYLGVASRRVEAGVFQIERGSEQVGRGLDLSFRAGRLDIGYQEIQSDYDASVRRLAFEWSAPRQQSFSVALEQARNDLFSRDDEQRVMFRFRKRFGGGPAFRAAEDNGGGAEEEERGFNKTLGIGLGVGIAAVALSSGDSGKDGAQRFAVRHNAARDVLNDINPVSVRQNREHGGWIYRNADNTFGYTDPVAGTVASVNLGNPVSSVPNGTRASASYHTHGGPDPRYDNENFSPQDLLGDRIVGVDGYLGTPAGFMKFHNHRTGDIKVLGRINN